VTARLDECLELMQRDDVDAMILGREANARTVADTSRLWLAGTRPFSPACIVVRATQAVHVLANSSDAVPAGFPLAQLYGLTWNPDRLAAELTAIPGLASARRVAVDGMSPSMRALLERVAPGAVLVDAGEILTDLWQRPDPARTPGVTAAAEVAAAGLAAMVGALAVGALPRQLRGACAAAFAAFGVTTPAFEAVATPIDPHSSIWTAPDRPFEPEERIVLRAGALRDGWEASLARTYQLTTSSVALDPPARWNGLVAACTAGATVGELRAKDAVVYGVGHGVEPWPDDFVLVPGLMCALEASDDNCVRQDVLQITETAPVIVTRVGST